MDSLLRWTLAGDSSSTLTSEILRRYAGTIQLKDGERGRLDHSRRRPADELVAFALAHQPANRTCRTNCSARRRTERPGRSRSPFPSASFRLRKKGASREDRQNIDIPTPYRAARRSTFDVGCSAFDVLML